jgi:hypothetical protein
MPPLTHPHEHPQPRLFGIRLTSVKAFARRWWPYVLTAVLVPGGIAIVLLMLLRSRRLVAG